MSVFQGLLEGFSGASDKAYLRNVEQEMTRRQGESKIYEYLLQSRDPKIQGLALTALLESARPTSKAKGLRGLMGDVEASSFWPTIQAAMDERIPNPEYEREMRAIAPPPRPGSAALPAQALVDPRAQGSPVPPEGQAPEGEEGPDRAYQALIAPPPAAPIPVGAPMEIPGPPQYAGATAAGLLPPPESRFKRRGTGVPTAEEIAESQAVAQLRGRLRATLEAWRQATPEERPLIEAMSGRPTAERAPQNIPNLLAVLPDGRTVPAAWDEDTNHAIGPDGQPFPPGTTFERQQSGAGGALSSFLEDTPESRAYLTQLGADPGVLAAGSPSGYWEYRRDTTGRLILNASEYVPPPDVSGTTTIYDQSSPTGRRIVQGRRTGGFAAGPPGPPGSEPSPATANARSLLALIDKEAASMAYLASGPFASMRRQAPPSAEQLDAATLKVARSMGSSYTRYADVRRDAQGAIPADAGAEADRGSIADRVFQRIQQETSGAPPPRPPARSQGPGPQRTPGP